MMWRVLLASLGLRAGRWSRFVAPDPSEPEPEFAH